MRFYSYFYPTAAKSKKGVINQLGRVLLGNKRLTNKLTYVTKIKFMNYF